MVTGRPHQSLERPGPITGRVVGRAGAQPDGQLLDLQLVDPRHQLAARRAAARTRRPRSEPARSRAPRRSPRARSGRPRAAPGSRPGSAPPASADPARRDRAGAGSGPSPGAPRPARRRAGPRSAPLHGAGREHDLRGARRARPPAAPRPGHRARGAVQLDRRHGRVLAHVHPGVSHARRRAPSTRRGSTEWSSGTSSASRTVGASAGSRSRASLGAQPLDAQAQRVAELELALQLARLVLVARDHQRAGPLQAHLLAARALQLGGERRPHRAERRPSSSSRLPAAPNSTSATGREHPGRDVRGAATDRVALQQRHRQSRRAGAPGDGEADDPAADDRDVAPAWRRSAIAADASPLSDSADVSRQATI